MKKLICILFFIQTFGFAQENLTVKTLNFTNKVNPNEHFSIFYELYDVNGLEKGLETKLNLPTDWRVLIEKTLDSTITNKKKFFTVVVPKFANSGKYNLNLHVTDNQKIIIYKKTDSIEVKKVRKVEIETVSKPENTREGDTLKIEYLVQNLGNIEEKIKFESLRAKLDGISDTLTLKPNQIFKAKLSQVIPTDEKNNAWQNSTDFKVYLKDSINPIIKTESFMTYASKNKKSDPYLRLPLEVGLWYNLFQSSTEGLKMGLQYDVRGKGYLDFAENHHIDFIIHGPNRLNFPAIGSFDQYSFDYSYKKKLRIQVGDYFLRFNNLMEQGRFGRGIRLDYDFNKVGFTTFFNSPRFFPDQKETIGGAFKILPSKNFKLALNYLGKNNRINNNFNWVNLIGLSSIYKTNNFQIETELSSSKALNKFDFGGFNRVLLQLKKIQFSSDLIYTGKHFYGFYKDSWLVSNSISYQLGKKIGVGISSNYTRLNPNYDLNILNTSPFYSNNMLSLSYAINSKQLLIFSYNMQEKEERGTEKKFHFKEDFTRLNYNYTGKKIKFLYNGRLGYSDNLLIKTDTSGRNISFSNMIQPQVKIFNWLWLGGYFDHQRNNKFATKNILKDYYFYGGSLNIIYKNKVNAYISYRNNFAPDELIELRSLVDINANFNFKRHQFTLTSGKVFIPNIAKEYRESYQNTLFLILKYSYKINVPIAKNKKVSNLIGQVYIPNNEKKSGFMFQLGDKKFITDSSGKFYFNNIIPDTYYLTLSQSSLKNGYAPIYKFPYKINFKADSTINLKVDMKKTGGVIGRIVFQNIDQIASKDITNNTPIVLAKLTNDSESFITQINKNHEFSFKEIRTGNWKLKVWVAGKEDQYNIDKALLDIKIESDSIKKIDYMVKPIERKIYFSQNNFNLISKKEESKKDEKKKDEIKVEPISKLKTKADSLNATSDVKKLKQEDSKKPEKTVQNTPQRKTFDKISVRAIKSKRKVVYLPSNKPNIWSTLHSKIALQKSMPSIIENPIETGHIITQPNLGESNSGDTEPNRELKNREKDKK